MRVGFSSSYFMQRAKKQYNNILFDSHNKCMYIKNIKLHLILLYKRIFVTGVEVFWSFLYYYIILGFV